MDPVLVPEMDPELDPELDPVMDPELDPELDPVLDPEMNTGPEYIYCYNIPQAPKNLYLYICSIEMNDKG